MTNAQDRFKVGQRVQLSEEGLRIFPRSRSTTGTVVGFGHQPHRVGVLRDGLKNRESYHEKFWEVAP